MLVKGKMHKKCKVNWSDVKGASPKPKQLHMEQDDTDSLYHCPIEECEHFGFQSQRGCWKHINTKHSWFSYFDEKHNSKQFTESLKIRKMEMKQAKPQDMACSYFLYFHSLVTLAVFTKWLTGSGGGCKKYRAAQQIVTRCFMCLIFCCVTLERCTCLMAASCASGRCLNPSAISFLSPKTEVSMANWVKL